MDRAIPKKRFTAKRMSVIAGSTAVLLLVSASYYFTSGKSKVNVETDRITISEIKRGPFQEFTPVNGVVMPISTIYMDAAEGGRVEEKYVEDGAIMKKDQPIMRLSNTDLELSLVNEQTSVYNLLTQMQISKNNATQNTISKLNQMADVENAWKEAERLYKINKQLYENKAVSLQEFNQAQQAFTYQDKRRKLIGQILKQDSSSRNLELDQTKQQYAQMKDALALVKRKVGDLIVRAPVDGQLTSLDAEIGQSKNKGQRLGQIDVLSGFKVRADIDEHYISRIFSGLKGDFQLGNKTYKLAITKVFTQVINNRFQVDMAFAGAAPAGIRRGQTLQVRLALSDETQALLLPKGGFYQQSAGNWIFKISNDGKLAYKADIQLGRQNPDFYEVMSGLKPGDKVVTSGYENYGDMQELVLK